ncbi:MAG: DUF1579 family protein [Verrucomicrobiia bacterium]
MKTLLALIAAASVTAVVAHADKQPPQPGPEHKRLEIWVGEWTFIEISQATPLGPAGKIVGKASVQPILNGWFIEFRNEAQGSSGPGQYREIDGYDSASQRYWWKGFLGDGSTHDVTYAIDGHTVPYIGTVTAGDKQYSIRGTAVFNENFSSFVEKREINTGGATWIPWFENKYIKTQSSPAVTSMERTFAASSALGQQATREDWDEYIKLMTGRWVGEVIWVNDWPGQGKRGDKVTCYWEIRPTEDGQALLGRQFGGNGSGTWLTMYDASAKQIRESHSGLRGNSMVLEIL